MILKKKIPEHCKVWKDWPFSDLVLISHAFLRTLTLQNLTTTAPIAIVSSINLNANAACPGYTYLRLVQMYHTQTFRKSSHFKFKWCTENSLKLLFSKTLSWQKKRLFYEFSPEHLPLTKFLWVSWKKTSEGTVSYKEQETNVVGMSRCYCYLIKQVWIAVQMCQMTDCYQYKS